MKKLTREPIFSLLPDSAGMIEWAGHTWLTIRHALIAAQFMRNRDILSHLGAARSPEMAEEIATGYGHLVEQVGDAITKEIFRAKLTQHPCVRRQLLALCDETAVNEAWSCVLFQYMDLQHWAIWLELRDELAECRKNQGMVLLYAA